MAVDTTRFRRDAVRDAVRDAPPPPSVAEQHSDKLAVFAVMPRGRGVPHIITIIIIINAGPLVLWLLQDKIAFRESG